jgi:hypothetical protein
MRQKALLSILFSITFLLTFTNCSKSIKYISIYDPAVLDVSFNNDDENKWNGKRIPDGQQCEKYGGEKPKTPKISVKNIPPGTNAIIMEYSDKNYKPMDNGGHGKVGYMISEGTTEVKIPSISGNSLSVPNNFFIVVKHKNIFAKEGAYMPPCSGGDNHCYYVTVKAVFIDPANDKNYQLLGEGKLVLGKY